MHIHFYSTPENDAELQENQKLEDPLYADDGGEVEIVNGSQSQRAS